MYCKGCGKEIKEDEMFCTDCGKPVAEDAQTPLTPEEKVGNSSFENRKTKRKSDKIFGFICAFVAFLAVALIQEFRVKDHKEEKNNVASQTVSVNSSDSNSETSEAYQEILSSCNIIEGVIPFLYSELSSFAIVHENNLVEQLIFGYTDDTVEDMLDVVYYPITGLTEEDKSALDANLREYFSNIEALDFSTFTYEMQDPYYVILIHFSDIDDPSHIQQLTDLGILQNDEYANRISMKMTESNLLADGYVKK